MTSPSTPLTHRTKLWRAALAALLLAWVSASVAQKATEMMIPVGQSSGQSGTRTVIAQVQSVDDAGRSLTLVQGTGTLTVRLGSRSALWLDRSKLQQPSITGSLADVKPGMRAEVKFVNDDRSAAEVEWLKAQILP